MRSLPDDDLVALYLRGDPAAFEVLFNRYDGGLFRFVVSLGADGDDADDVVQRTWMKALAALEGYRPSGRFRSWLFRIAHRLWIEDRRGPWVARRVDRDEDAREDAAPGLSPRDAVAAREQRRLVDDALHRLPDAMREAILLRIDGDLTHREISELMKCPLGTTLWRISEGEKRLRRMLGEGDGP